MDIITQKVKRRLSVLKYAKNHDVTKASGEFGVSRQTIYRWRKRYDRTEKSLKPKSRRPFHHPNEHSLEEIALIKEMHVKYPHDGLNMFWHKLKSAGYTRSMSALFRVMHRLDLYRTKPKNPKYVPKPYEQATFPGLFLQQLVKAFSFKINKVQTDNGFEFTKRFSRAKEGDKTLFEEQLVVYNIEYQIIRPYTPRHNGKVERSHRKDNEYFYALNQFASFEDFRQKLADWNEFSNDLPMRPLGFKSPRQLLSSFL